MPDVWPCDCTLGNQPNVRICSSQHSRTPVPGFVFDDFRDVSGPAKLVIPAHFKTLFRALGTFCWNWGDGTLTSNNGPAQLHLPRDPPGPLRKGHERPQQGDGRNIVIGAMPGLSVEMLQTDITQQTATQHNMMERVRVTNAQGQPVDGVAVSGLASDGLRGRNDAQADASGIATFKVPIFHPSACPVFVDTDLTKKGYASAVDLTVQLSHIGCSRTRVVGAVHQHDAGASTRRGDPPQFLLGHTRTQFSSA